jgi:hypothetical protein
VWVLLIVLVGLGILKLVEYIDERRRQSAIPRCRHNIRGFCASCELEALQARRHEDEQNRLSISREYWSIPENERQRLRSLAEDHIQRSDIPTTAGSIEVAVVNMWQRSKEAQKH